MAFPNIGWPATSSRFSTGSFSSVVCLLLGLIASGCSSKPDMVSLQDQAEQLVARADEATKQNSFQEAHDLYTQALRSGGVGRDKMPEICRKRLIVGAKIGEFEEAEIDLQAIFELASTPAEGLSLQSFLFKKQGKLAEAKKLLQQAKRIDPKIQPVDE